MWRRSGPIALASGNVQSRSQPSTRESDWNSGVNQRVMRW